MDTVRFATPEEVEPIASELDITPTSSVVTFGGKDFAVIRDCREMDPVKFHEDTKNQRKLLFLMNLETAMRLQGTREVYFNVKCDDQNYLEILKHWGAEQISPTPEFRFKKVL